MRIGTLGAAAALSLIVMGAGAASAADLSYPSPPTVSPIYSPVSAYQWTGFYLGVNGGFGSGNAISSTPYDGSIGGIFGGAQIGYNYQLPSNLVIGVEADVQASGLDGTISASSPRITQSLGWFGTVRGRLGYAFDNVMPYVTGGVAFGGATRTSSVSSSSESKGVTGYAIGAGVEMGLANNWSVKGEYQYVNFGAVTYNNIPANPSVKLDAHTFRIGLNKRF